MAFDDIEFKDCLGRSLAYAYAWEPDARMDFRFYGIDQWPDEDKEIMGDRPALTFDRTRTVIDSVSGTEKVSRYEPRFAPRDPGLRDQDIMFSEPASKVYKWIRQRADAEQAESAMFQSTVICGVGCTSTEMEYDEDPEGKIVIYRVPIFQMLWDPHSVQPNMKDGRYVIRDRWVDEDEIQSLFGEDSISKVKELAGRSNQKSAKTLNLSDALGKTLDDARATSYLSRRGLRFYDAGSKKIRLWECQRYDKKYVNKIVVDENIAQVLGEQGQEILVEKKDTQEFMESLREINETVTQTLGIAPESPVIIENFPVRRYMKSYHAGNEMIKQKEMPEKRFTYQFTTCFESWDDDQDHRYFFGLMKPMRDPQRYANKFFSQAVYLWASDPKGALLYEDGFFESEETAKKNYASAKGMIRVKRGTLSGSKGTEPYRQLQSTMSFRGSELLLQHAINSIPEAAGVNKEYFGGGASDLRRTAASSIESIREANLATISGPFASLRAYRKSHALLALSMIRSYMPKSQISKVLDGDDAAMSEIFSTTDLERQYDISVEEVPVSPSKQMEVFRTFMETNFIPQLMEAGVPVPPSVAKFFPVPSDVQVDFERALQDVYDVVKMEAESRKMELQLQMMQMQQAAMMGPAGMQQGPPRQGPQGVPPQGEPPIQ